MAIAHSSFPMLCCPDDLTPAHLSTQDTRHSIRFERVSHLNHANTTRHQHEAKFAGDIRRFVFVQVAKGLAIPSYPSYRPPSLRHGFVFSQTCRIVPCVPCARTRKSHSGKPYLATVLARPDNCVAAQTSWLSAKSWTISGDLHNYSRELSTST